MLTIMSNHYLEVAWLNGQLQRMVVVLQLLAANLKRYGLTPLGSVAGWLHHRQNPKTIVYRHLVCLAVRLSSTEITLVGSR